ncbi:MAG TPA: biotin/lipoyl-containing protein [Blastocatellia bacterium]|nr:biotin/lipoyl-containing protein [Blastocatellia bacterium]
MKEIIIEKFDANSEVGVFLGWRVSDGATVRKGEVLCEVETEKAVYEVHSEASGILVQKISEGAKVAFNEAVIGFIASDEKEAAKLRETPASQAAPANETSDLAEIKATRKAIELAKQSGVDLKRISKKSVITEDDVRQLIQTAPQKVSAVPLPGVYPPNVNRILVISAAYGAMQVIDILLNDPHVRVIGCVDDDPELAGIDVFGVPVLGKTDQIESLWEQKAFDSAIVATGRTPKIRKKLFDQCVALGIPMANAIDPTVRINRGVSIGRGNVICGHVHIGTCTQLGDNNFISANSSIDHHNVWGSHIATGPNCVTSGLVTVQDGVRMGTGIFIQPKLEIGAGAIIASGAILQASVPAAHAVKIRVSVELVPLNKQADEQAS